VSEASKTSACGRERGEQDERVRLAADRHGNGEQTPVARTTGDLRRAYEIRPGCDTGGGNAGEERRQSRRRRAQHRAVGIEELSEPGSGSRVRVDQAAGWAHVATGLPGLQAQALVD